MKTIKTISLALISILLFATAGCGGDASSDGNTGSDNGSSNNAAVPNETASIEDHCHYIATRLSLVFELDQFKTELNQEEPEEDQIKEVEDLVFQFCMNSENAKQGNKAAFVTCTNCLRQFPESIVPAIILCTEDAICGFF